MQTVLRTFARQRLFMAALAPVVALVLFSGYVIEGKLSDYRESSAMLMGAKVARAAHSLARNLELERGATAVVLTGGIEAREEMDDRRALTDDTVHRFRSLVRSAPIRPLFGGAEPPDFGLGGLDAARASVDASPDLKAALADYSRVIGTLISTSSRLSPHSHSHIIAAYMDLGHIKDRLSRQRSIGTAWVSGRPADPTLAELFRDAAAERKAFTDSFKGHATPEQIGILDRILNGPLMAHVLDLHERALTGGLGPSEAQEWHKSHLALLDELVNAETRMAAEMEAEIQAHLDAAQTTFYLVVAVVVVLVVFSLETLRRSERRAAIAQDEARKLFRAVEQSPVSIMITDPAGAIEYINPAFSRMTGYQRDEILGRNPRLLRSHKTHNDVYNALWRMIRSGQEWRGEIINRRKDGTEYWEQMTIAPVKGSDDDVINYIALKEDVTEVRSLRQALEREHGNIRRILESTHDSIALLDKAGRFEYANPAFLVEFGDPDGRTCSAFFQDDGRDCPGCAALDATAIGSREWRSDKTGKTYEVTATPVTNPDGAESTLQVFHDITARKRAEEATIQAREAAELANRAKTEFLATMSHELRTPLNAIIGFSEIIESQLLGPVGQQQYLEYAHDINASGRHLLQLITDILDVSRIEANRVALREEVLSPAAVVIAAVNMVRDRADAGNLDLRTTLPDGLPMLWADNRRIKQVLVNVLGNAVKFTPAGGSVRVSAAVEPSGELAFAVADTGIGIAAEEFEKVMAPFGQVDSGMARRYEGSGLGLPLSRKLMEMHGGTLTLESQPGHGTTVTLRFPAERVRAAEKV